jgi:hypothetical protein
MEEEAQQLKKIRVWVPMTHDVSYVIEVKDPSNIDEVSEALARKDPSQWESDPCFYEHLGDEWKHLVNKVKKENIETLEEQDAAV